MDRDKRISKTLSKILRHDAIKQNIPISPNGYVKIEDLLNHKWFKSHQTNLQDIERIVTGNDKQRFKITDGMICALQGHSMKLEEFPDDLIKLSNADLPNVIVHGTFRSKLNGIKEMGGLSRMNRNHVHFATGIPEKFKGILTSVSGGEEVISGMRLSCQIIIFLDVDKLKRSNLDVYKSGNGVILIPGDSNGIVSENLFDKVIDVDDGLINL